MVNHALFHLTRRSLLAGAIGTSAVLLSGCSFQDGGGGLGTGTGERVLRMLPPGDVVESLDPHFVGGALNLVPACLLEGLVMQDAAGVDVVPAAAEGWVVSEDGLTYTFTLRAGASWSNGDPVTAQDAEWTFRRLLSPTGATSTYAAGGSSYKPGLGIVGAVDFQTGAQSDWEQVGIRAEGETTLIIELESPNPDLLIGMTDYSMVLMHPPTVEAMPQDWQQPENWVGNGPFVLTGYAPTTQIVMVPNERYWDAATVAVDRVELSLGLDASQALLAFQNGELDVVRASASMPTLRDDEQAMSEMARVEGYQVFYLQSMWGGNEAVNDERVRRAVGMAIDRTALAGIEGFSQPGISLVPGSVPGWSDSLAIPFDLQAVEALLAEAGLGDRTSRPGIRLQTSVQADWLIALMEQLEDNLGMTAQLDVLEAGVMTDTRWQPVEDTSVISFYLGSFGGISTMNNWVNTIFGPDFVRQFSMSAEAWQDYQDAQASASGSSDGVAAAAMLQRQLREGASDEANRFAELAEQARSTLDEAERTGRYLDAALLRQEMSHSIPLLWTPMMYLAADRVSGLQPRSSPEGFYYKHLRLDA